MFEPKDKKFDKDSLRTPWWLVEWLDSRYCFTVDLAASDEHHYFGAYFTKESSAFYAKWENFGSAGFCNPPYSKIDPWVSKAIESSKKGFTTVFVIPDFNGEARFEKISAHATTIIHLIGRVSFIRPDNGQEYKGNNRGSSIVEFAPNLWERPPVHLYRNIKDIRFKYDRDYRAKLMGK